MWWQTIYVCPDCGRAGIRPNDRLAGRCHLYCPGCQKLMSKGIFKKEHRLMDDYAPIKTRFTITDYNQQGIDNYARRD